MHSVNAMKNLYACIFLIQFLIDDANLMITPLPTKYWESACAAQINVSGLLIISIYNWIIIDIMLNLGTEVLPLVFDTTV